MMRQTFYITNEVSRLLKRVAVENEQKISNIVNDALAHYLALLKKKPRKTLAIFKYAGKIKAFKNTDPIVFQRKERGSWDH